jgi:hypothetical protein
MALSQILVVVKITAYIDILPSLSREHCYNNLTTSPRAAIAASRAATAAAAAAGNRPRRSTGSGADRSRAAVAAVK